MEGEASRIHRLNEGLSGQPIELERGWWSGRWYVEKRRPGGGWLGMLVIM